jgi:hypothetical protein
MLRQSKVPIKFNNPVLGFDIYDGEEISSNKHWVIAEVMLLENQRVIFQNYDDKITGNWAAEDIFSIRLPVLDSDESIIRAQKSYDYQREVKAQRPAAWSQWTREEELQVLELHSQGLNAQEIADIHQRTHRAISERMLKLGIEEHDYPSLGVRPEKRHFEDVMINGTKNYMSEARKVICLGCSFEIFSRPCKCWFSKDTSQERLWREHRYNYSMFGSVIGQNY